MSEWISVEDAVPVIYEPVVALRLGEPVLACRCEEIATWEEGGGISVYWDDFNNEGQGWENSEITHWATIPEPLKEDM